MNDGPAGWRFSRDKRGYENFYLVRSFRRRGRSRTRILYWFRTPPNVKVGRKPFDEEVRRAIERQNPGVVFDWKKIIETPIPPPQADVERWRERRRLERAVRLADQPDAAAETDLDDAAELEPVAETEESAAAMEEVGPVSEADIALPEVLTVAPEGQTSPEIPPDRAGGPSRHRGRRRRGGRRHRRHGRGAAAAGPSEPLNSPSSADAGPSPKRDSEP